MSMLVCKVNTMDKVSIRYLKIIIEEIGDIDNGNYEKRISSKMFINRNGKNTHIRCSGYWDTDTALHDAWLYADRMGAPHDYPIKTAFISRAKG